MFYSIKDGEAAKYGINYLSERSKLLNMYVFEILIPWFGNTVCEVYVAANKPFSKPVDGGGWAGLTIWFFDRKDFNKE